MKRYRIITGTVALLVLGLLTSAQGHADDLNASDLEDITTLQNSADLQGEAKQEAERTVNEEVGKGTDNNNEAVGQEASQAQSSTPPILEVEEVPNNTANTNIKSGEMVVDAQQGDTGTGDASVRNEVTNLEFKMEGSTSRILISSRSRLAYSETRNQGMKQIVYLFQNTVANQRLERAYDTTEFVSPVALFTLLQIPKKSPPSTKLIIQLREDKSPNVVNTDKGMYIDFAAPDQRLEQKLLTSDESKQATEENIYSGNQVFTGKTIRRLEIKNSDIQDVIRLIAKTSGYNVVIGDDVTGKVGTMSLENVPWDQAFTLVLQSKKLGYIRQGNVLRVGTLAALKSEKDEAISTEASKVRVEPLRTVIIPISYAKAGEMVSRAKVFLSERGSAEADNRSNSVILKDIDRNVTKIQKLFAVLDNQPPKVNISAKFVELTQEYGRRIGITHNFTANISGLNITQGITGGTNGTNATSLIRANNFANLSTTLALGETDTKVKVLASPSLAVNSNQKGTITYGTQFSFPSRTVNAQGGIVDTIATVTANLILDVTPIVAGDGSISMDVSLQNDIPKPANSTAATALINIDTRRIQTQVLVENGDTIVIGGIFTDTVTKARDGIPLLMNIPLLGYLFSGSSDIVNRGEVMIFLTPKLLNAEEAFKRSL